jgi:hypothetical protein
LIFVPVCRKIKPFHDRRRDFAVKTMQTVYVLLAAALMLAWLVLLVRGPRRVEVPNLAVLRYGVFWRSLALALALAPPVIMVYAVWGVPWRNEATLTFAGVLFLATSVVCGLPLIEATRVQIVITEEGLLRHSPWSGPLTVKWIEVESVRYSALNRWFIVAGAGQAIRVSRYLGGIGAFVEAVRRKVAAERCVSAAAALEAAQ